LGISLGAESIFIIALFLSSVKAVIAASDAKTCALGMMAVGLNSFQYRSKEISYYFKVNIATLIIN
jgi:hypothetical protein